MRSHPPNKDIAPVIVVDEGVNDTVDYVYKHGFCVAFGVHVWAFRFYCCFLYKLILMLV